MVTQYDFIRARSGQLPPLEDIVFDKRSPPPIRSSAVCVCIMLLFYCISHFINDFMVGIIRTDKFRSFCMYMRTKF